MEVSRFFTIVEGNIKGTIVDLDSIDAVAGIQDESWQTFPHCSFIIHRNNGKNIGFQYNKGDFADWVLVGTQERQKLVDAWIAYKNSQQKAAA